MLVSGSRLIAILAAVAYLMLLVVWVAQATAEATVRRESRQPGLAELLEDRLPQPRSATAAPGEAAAAQPAAQLSGNGGASSGL